MLRVLIGTGCLLMVVGFGAAGWQYWSSQRADATNAQDVALTNEGGALPQASWLMSPTGGLVASPEASAYLLQDRLVAGRIATVTHTAPLTDLLADGETLPAQPYLQVFADIRAPRMAEGLCPALLASLAQDCALHGARVVPGSVDTVRGTARFRIDLAYRLKPEPDALPDLGAHVFQSELVAVGAPLDPPAPEAAPEAETGDAETGEDLADAPVDTAQSPPVPTVVAALDTVVAAALKACSSQDDRLSCRVMRLTADWSPDTPPSGEASVSWLSALPEGVIAAPQLDVAPPG